MKFLFQSSALKFKTIFGSKKPHSTGNAGIIKKCFQILFVPKVVFTKVYKKVSLYRPICH